MIKLLLLCVPSLATRLAAVLVFAFAFASRGFGAPVANLTFFTEARSAGTTQTGEALAVRLTEAGETAVRAEILLTDSKPDTLIVLNALTASQAVAGTNANATARVTFTLSESTDITARLRTARGQVAVVVDDEAVANPRLVSRTLAPGTHTVRLVARNSESTQGGLSDQQLLLTIRAPLPDPLEFIWKTYADGAWDEGESWKSDEAPGTSDVAKFDLLPPAGQRSGRLPFINVSAGTLQRSGGLDISRSAVRIQGFDLALTGNPDEPDALTLRNGAELFINVPPGGSRTGFATVGTAIGDGKRQAFSKECLLTISESVVWTNVGPLGIGERMAGAVQIETRLPGETSQCNGDVFLGLLPGSEGSLEVLGSLETGPVLAASRPRTSASLGVTRGGILVSETALAASAAGTSFSGVIDDSPAAEAGSPRDYTSVDERTTWQVQGLLSLAGTAASVAGNNGGGTALLKILGGGLITAGSAEIGAGQSSFTSPRRRSANLLASGFDPTSEDPSELRIEQALTVGQGGFGFVDVQEGGTVSAESIRVKALGRLSIAGGARNEAGVIFKRSLITTSPQLDPGVRIAGPITVDGGGTVELEKSGDLEAGVMTLGGITPRRVPARLVVDSSNLEFSASLLSLQKLIVGQGPDFPAIFELRDGVVSIAENSEIAAGSELVGFGKINAPAGVALQNNGRIIIPPGVFQTLAVGGEFAQAPSGELVLAFNKDSDPNLAPLKVNGSSLVLGGKVKVEFVGGQKPKRGETYAVVRAESALISRESASFTVAGSRLPFDIVEDDFGIVLVFQ